MLKKNSNNVREIALLNLTLFLQRFSLSPPKQTIKEGGTTHAFSTLSLNPGPIEKGDLPGLGIRMKLGMMMSVLNGFNLPWVMYLHLLYIKINIYCSYIQILLHIYESRRKKLQFSVLNSLMSFNKKNYKQFKIYQKGFLISRYYIIFWPVHYCSVWYVA